MQRLESKIRAIPDFPRSGVVFRDITPLVGDSAMLRLAVDQLVHPFVGEPIDAVAGMEARGFIFGALVAQELNVGFVPLRKPGKLPYDVQSVSYELEYGTGDPWKPTSTPSIRGIAFCSWTTSSPPGVPHRQVASSSSGSAARSRLARS